MIFTANYNCKLVFCSIQGDRHTEREGEREGDSNKVEGDTAKTNANVEDI